MGKNESGRLAAFALAACALATSACGEIKKASECTAVIDVMNEAEKAAPKGADDDLGADIKAMEEWDAKISKVEVTDEGLKKRVADYRELIKGMSDDAKLLQKLDKATADGADPADADKVAKQAQDLAKRMEEISGKEDKIVADLNKYCGRE